MRKAYVPCKGWTARSAQGAGAAREGSRSRQSSRAELDSLYVRLDRLTAVEVVDAIRPRP